MVERKFCWLPTKVYSRDHCLYGFAWIRYVWHSGNGYYYITQQAAWEASDGYIFG